MQNHSWETKEGQLVKEFEFNNFEGVMRFVNQVADLAEAHNHHPDFFIHKYKYVTLSLMTHSAGEITEKDHALAAEIDTVLV